MTTLDQTNSHECSACGGTGSQGAHFYLCQVCLGAVRLPDRMPVSDALADRETLRAFVVNYRTRPGKWLAPDRLLYSESVKAAAGRVRTALRKAHRHNFRPSEVTLAARAAFRAVPGLRGE